jgi:2-keto-4-pentenoate hydratase/2-oxohepta-3-ene-1,7-dioic acid hydratase in catechol pathway
VKLATFTVAGQAEPKIGVVDTTQGSVLALQDLHRALHGRDNPLLIDMLALMDGGDPALDLARSLIEAAKGKPAHRHALTAIKLLSPVPIPRQLRDFNNHEQHWRDASWGMARLKARVAGQPEPDRAKLGLTIPPVNYTQPIFYISNRFSVVGTDVDVTWPRYSKWLDYEAEFGVWIGRYAKNVTKANAMDHVFGYSIFNDFSARDTQAREMEGRMGPTKGKSFDSGNAIGPWIVTRDEIPDPRKLTVEVRINGKRVAGNTTAGIVHGFDDFIAYISQEETIHAGEFLGSGTIGGCCALENDHWPKVGDVVEIEFSGLGVLRNRLVASV